MTLNSGLLLFALSAEQVEMSSTMPNALRALRADMVKVLIMLIATPNIPVPAAHRFRSSEVSADYADFADKKARKQGQLNRSVNSALGKGQSIVSRLNKFNAPRLTLNASRLALPLSHRRMTV